ncbi:HAD family hydrolase [Sutcliffiella rhizosphaerae]|uniref:Phosphoglycolate phosphatase n=1 Tax=Sutcliffiella rhizosphaerae TaxID=2880967 RepID=A0ABM8YNX7_9BACI|nr:HAD family hydrolase [Sutcliffiella rhizosphaerae]CAG9621499.1 Phosphoglycolate phosphatase [Sutcliffiella rhizosphaerae]
MHNIRTIVFDLDGTLYEDTHHFRYYADLLREMLPKEYQASFEKDYSAVETDQHTLKIGRVYDAKEDLILAHQNGNVIDGWQWDGEKVTKEELNSLYPNTLEFDLFTMLSIGDLWWIPVSIAKHYGLSSEDAYSAFLQTREHMMTDSFILEPLKEFAQVLEKLHGKYKLVLMTNSPQTDSDVILKKLGFTSYFHEKIFEANKPASTSEQLTYISNKFNVSFEEMLSIGDNYINEILPAARLGCHTICIDSFNLFEESESNITVKNLAELAELLENDLLNEHQSESF